MNSEKALLDKRSIAPLIFFAKTILCQMIALAICILAWSLYPQVSAVLIAASIAAFITANFLSLSAPWSVLNLLLPLGAACALMLEIPNFVFLVLLVALVCVYVPAFWTRVPYYPTQRAAYAFLLAELPTDRPFTFIDVGCGFGELLFFLSKKRPNGSFIGVEIGPLPFLLAKLRSLFCSDVSIRFQSMWRTELTPFDYVYTFLSPAPMERIWLKASSEMRQGATFISNSFPAPVESDSVIALKDSRRSSLYLYRIGA